MRPHLFDQFGRSEMRFANESESFYGYLNVSARASSGHIRTLLEEWFEKYPEIEKNELHGRLTSEDDVPFLTAFFELYLSALLAKIGCQTEHHPALPSEVLKHPDMLVTEPNGEKFYLEAVCAFSETAAQRSSKQRREIVFDLINTLDSPNFWLLISEHGEPSSQPSVEKLKGGLRLWLDSLNPKDVAEKAKISGHQDLPKFEFSHEEWILEIQALPKLDASRSNPSGKVIGVHTQGVRLSGAERAIRKAISSKGGRYRKLDLPFVIAINVLPDFLDTEDVVNALFGTEQGIYDIKSRSQIGMTRKWDGGWLSRQGPVWTRNSGILICSGLNPWNVAHRGLTLYRNPWATKPYRGVLQQFSEAILENEMVHFKAGIEPKNIFEFPDRFPLHDEGRG